MKILLGSWMHTFEFMCACTVKLNIIFFFNFTNHNRFKEMVIYGF